MLPSKAWKSGKPAYRFKVIGQADDHAPPNGADILDFRQAQEKAIAHAEHLKRSTGMLPQSLTVDVAIAKYVLRVEANKGKASSEDARARLAKHVPPSLRSRLAADLGLDELPTWLDDLVIRKEHPVSRSTANRILANFRAALNLAFKDSKSGVRSADAWRNLAAFGDVTTPREDHFEAEDVLKLINEARKFDSAFAALLAAGFLTGARYGELCACDVNHFDRKSDVLSIPSGKTGARAVSLTKSKQSRDVCRKRIAPCR